MGRDISMGNIVSSYYSVVYVLQFDAIGQNWSFTSFLLQERQKEGWPEKPNRKQRQKLCQAIPGISFIKGCEGADKNPLAWEFQVQVT